MHYVQEPQQTMHEQIYTPDLVASLHSDPLRDGPVLLLLLGEKALDPESLVGRLKTRVVVVLSIM